MSTSDIVALVAVIIGGFMTAFLMLLGFLFKRMIDSWDNSIKKMAADILSLTDKYRRLARLVTELVLRMEWLEESDPKHPRKHQLSDLDGQIDEIND